MIFLYCVCIYKNGKQILSKKKKRFEKRHVKDIKSLLKKKKKNRQKRPEANTRVVMKKKKKKATVSS